MSESELPFDELLLKNSINIETAFSSLLNIKYSYKGLLLTHFTTALIATELLVQEIRELADLRKLEICDKIQEEIEGKDRP